MDKQDEQETQTEHNDSPANGNGMFYAAICNLGLESSNSAVEMA